MAMRDANVFLNSAASQHPYDPADAGDDEAQDGSPRGKWRHPPSFYCPISQQCMHDPVVLADGHTYERQYIKKWLEEHDTSPVSGLKLPQMTMYPNHALRNAIEEYFQQVFSAHRRAIRQSLRAPENAEESLSSNQPLLRTIDALMQCSLLVNADLSLGCVLRRIMEEAKTLVGAEVASVFLVDETRQELYSTVNSTDHVIRIPIGNGIAGHVATSGEPIVIHDAYGDWRFNKSVDAKTGFKTRNVMCVPLKVKKGRVIGVVQLINKCSPSAFLEESGGMSTDADFSAEDVHFVQVFASQAASAIGNIQVSEDPQLQPTSSSDEGCPQQDSLDDQCGFESRVIRKPSKGSASSTSEKACSGDMCLYTAPQWDGPEETLGENEAQCSAQPLAEEAPAKQRRSGRARQRAAKWRASVRLRTPSP